MKTLLLLTSFTLVTACAAGCATDLIDYSRYDSWLAFPGHPSPANLTPRDSGFSNLQKQAKADVFYVHPTTGMRKDAQNVPIDDPDALRMGLIMLMSQATPFNAVGRIFAPRYRQIALHVYDQGEDGLQEPMNRAYADVRRAFEYYVDHQNDGRPFFIVGHSQGANHAQRLVSEVIQGTPLERRLVAAYLPGNPVPRSVFADDLTRIPPCVQPAQTGCAAIWGTFGEGYTEFKPWEENNVYWDAPRQRWHAVRGQSLFNVNPVTWTDDVSQAPASLHRGAVPFGVPATHFTRPLPQLVSTRNDGRYTFVSPTPLPANLFNDGGVFGGANYHVFDINLFWIDIRENARQRLAALLLREDNAAYPVLSGPAVVSTRAGAPFRFHIDAANLPATFRVEGMPEGLSLDAEKAEISGIPLRAGTHSLIITGTNAAGSDTAELALIVLARDE